MYTPEDVKKLRFTEDEVATLKRLADSRNSSMSEVLRIMIERFLARGTRARQKQKTRLVTTFIEREISDRAEKKAREEYGLTLRDVLRHEISASGSRD